MSGRRGEPAAGTARILLVGTVLSVTCFAGGLGLTLAGLAALADLAAKSGVLALLLTPAFGLVMTAIELRRSQPQAAVLALAVLAVLGVAVLIALLAG